MLDGDAEGLITLSSMLQLLPTSLSPPLDFDHMYINPPYEFDQQEDYPMMQNEQDPLPDIPYDALDVVISAPDPLVSDVPYTVSRSNPVQSTSSTQPEH